MTPPSPELAAAVRRACSAPGTLQVHFQPIADLARGIVCGYEALARFHGPPALSPDRWFAAAHALGCGEELEARALRTALAGRHALPPNCFLTVNLGPAALVSAPVGAVLAAAGDLRGIVVEVTEQSPVEDYDALLAALEAPRAAGALVAVDDAGAGFASLRHITALRPDMVKVDRGLVAGVDRDPAKAAVLETLGFFASRIDAWLLAEGIETEAELERLIGLGVPLGQGYGLGRPSPAMAPLDPAVAALCRRRAGARPGELAALLEEVATLPAAAGDAAVAEALLRRPGAEWAVAVDEFRRPVALVPRPGRIAGRARRPVLAVPEGDAVPDVARRAATRDAADRHLPLAVTDELGHLLGIVRVERLLEALADRADGRRATRGGAGGTGRRSA